VKQRFGEFESYFLAIGRNHDGFVRAPGALSRTRESGVPARHAQAPSQASYLPLRRRASERRAAGLPAASASFLARVQRLTCASRRRAEEKVGRGSE